MKSFGHVRPVRDEAGNIVDTMPAPARRVTVGELGGAFGPDKHRRLVVCLAAGDVIVFRPQSTRQEVALPAVDCYRYALRCKALADAAEKRQRGKERAR
jgi:hypothetical protein